MRTGYWSLAPSEPSARDSDPSGIESLCWTPTHLTLRLRTLVKPTITAMMVGFTLPHFLILLTAPSRSRSLIRVKSQLTLTWRSISYPGVSGYNSYRIRVKNLRSCQKIHILSSLSYVTLMPIQSYLGIQFPIKSKSRLQIQEMWIATTPPYIINSFDFAQELCALLKKIPFYFLTALINQWSSRTDVFIFPPNRNSCYCLFASCLVCWKH